VVLCLAGGEALYADMGHFGALPIRLAWYGLALPALAINYMGQGALLLRAPADAARPFYSIVPAWGLIPLVILATLATVVASQALISAVFSLTRQASQLGLGPRVQTRHTSHDSAGQIYLPTINWLMMMGTIAIVLIFRRSDHLAAAFGLAVSMTMSVTTVIFVAFARTRWHWSNLRVLWVAGVFMLIDKAFVIANTLKFIEGGWLPVLIGTLLFLLSFSWFYGMRVLRQSRADTGLPIDILISSLADSPPHRVHGTAVFMMAPGSSAPVALLHHLKHNQVLHERVVLLTILTEESPRVELADCLTIAELQIGVIRIVARYGYMQEANVPNLLELAQKQLGCCLYDPMSTSFYLGRETLSVPHDGNFFANMFLHLFIWLHKNELDSTSHFGIPPNRVVELGARLDLVRHH
jgi:KUP system potassium uptake protein